MPYKIELNARGQIEMSPATNWHGYWRVEIGALLRELLKRRGKAFSKASLDTPENVKVPDVVWASKEFLEHYGRGTPFPRALEICVEIIPPSNTQLEIESRQKLYFSQGAHEVWLCNLEGKVTFFDRVGEREYSAITPNFSVQLEA